MAAKLKLVFIKAWQRNDITRRPDEQSGFLVTGKKNEVVALSATNVKVTIKTGRQLFAKVPGIFVYDMDASCNQLALSTGGSARTVAGHLISGKKSVIVTPDLCSYAAGHCGDLTVI